MGPEGLGVLWEPGGNVNLKKSRHMPQSKDFKVKRNGGRVDESQSGLAHSWGKGSNSYSQGNTAHVIIQVCVFKEKLELYKENNQVLFKTSLTRYAVLELSKLSKRCST
eukprot:TRINITY_DN19202_c1_g1_i1.p1 TRINITY_DN19202_c1_g1~~TRINITY_DN19202_c1_g1_i1.p1  ORF type:complete len:109 (+),score=13.16 TRINITY_DN19202_c1_g1_i1:89-415(+)